ncbi:radical SAM protein [Tenuifilum osseticum]|uniref:radical SAM protein n=1 Tax=Tenuifilum osseticum TaxID=3374723 RepID=UPI0034E5A3E9
MKRKIICFKTNSNNYYLYSFRKRTYFLITPTLYKIITYGINVAKKELLEKQNGLSVSVFDVETVEDIEYALVKYNFFVDNGVISESVDFNILKNPDITKEIVFEEIAQCENIVLEVTQKCNLNCTYCINGKYYNNISDRRSLSFETAITFIDFILSFNYKQYKRNNLTIGFYGGEPLLEIDLIKKIITYIEDKYSSIAFKYKITTNGTLLKQNIDFLIKNKFKITISLDGDKNHNIYRKFKNGKESYNIVVSNIDYLKNKYPNYFGHNLVFQSVYHKKSSIESIYSFFKNRYNKIPGVSILSEFGLNEYNKDFFYKNLFKAFENKHNDYDNHLSSINAYFLNRFIKNNIGIYYKNSNCIEDKNVPYMRILCSCIPFKNEPFLRADGTIHRCTEIDTLPIGRVCDQTVNIDYDNILTEFNRFTEKLNMYCQVCYNFFNCDFCIYRASPFENTKKVICDEFKNYSGGTKFYKDCIQKIEDSLSHKELLTDIFYNLFLYDEFE